MSYFPPDYFGATVPAAVPVKPDPDQQQLTDAGALAWVGEILGMIGVFGKVAVGAQAARSGIGTADYPFAWVWPVSFSEADQGDASAVLRTLRYAVAIALPLDQTGELAALARLDGLSGAVADQLSGVGPDGSIPALSRVTGGRYDLPSGTSSTVADGTSVFGQARVVLACEVAYLIDGRAGRPVPD